MADILRGRPRPPGFRAGLVAGIVSSAVLALVLTCGRAPEQKKGAAGSPSSAEDERIGRIVIAHVGRQKITVKDMEFKIGVQFSGMMNGLEGGARLSQQMDVLNQMVNQYAWVEAGERRGFDKDKDFLATLELSRKFVLSNVTVQKLVYDKCEPTEADIQSYYAENPDQFRQVAEIHALDILAPTQAAAENARRRALAGEDFGVLARQVSTDDKNNELGGELGQVTLRSDVRGFGGPSDLNAKIMELQAGQISEPIQTSRGWAIFKAVSRIEEGEQPLDDVRESIRKKLSTKKANALFASILDQIKTETGAGVDEKGWQDYTYAVLTDDQIFEMAEGEKVPQERIKIYQGLVDRRPKSPRAAQALFMVGFTYADDLRRPDEARPVFQDLLKKYPDSDLASSARWMLDNMDKGLGNLPYAEQLKHKAISG